MKKIRNIVPLTLGGMVIEPGTVFEYNINLKEYRVSPNSCIGRITDAQASDRRLFEPVEERFIRNGEPCHAISASGGSCDLRFFEGCRGDEMRLAFGNVFRVDTKENPSGVHIVDAQKVLMLALRVPKLWKCLKWLWDTESYVEDNPISYKERRAIKEIVHEIETAATPQKGREA